MKHVVAPECEVVTRALQHGLSLGEVSQLLGHTTLTQTQKYAKYEATTTVNKAKEALNARRGTL